MNTDSFNTVSVNGNYLYVFVFKIIIALITTHAAIFSLKGKVYIYTYLSISEKQ